MDTGKSVREFEFDSLVEDTSENLRGIFNRVIGVVKRDCNGELCFLGNSYNPLAYQLSPKWPTQGVNQEYYDQRIAIYNHVLKVVDKVRGKFSSSNMGEFKLRIKEYIDDCNRYKDDVKKSHEFSKFVNENHYTNSDWYRGMIEERKEMVEAITGLVKCIDRSQQRMLKSYSH